MAKSKHSEVYREYIQVIKKFSDVDNTRNYKNIVGDLGEEFACSHYGLIRANGTGHDAVKGDLKIEIKTRTNTNGKVEIKPDAKATVLIVLHLDDNGEFTEYYYGSMKIFFENAKYVERTKDYQMSLVNLKRLNPGTGVA